MACASRKIGTLRSLSSNTRLKRREGRASIRGAPGSPRQELRRAKMMLKTILLGALVIGSPSPAIAQVFTKQQQHPAPQPYYQAQPAQPMIVAAPAVMGWAGC